MDSILFSLSYSGNIQIGLKQFTHQSVNIAPCTLVARILVLTFIFHNANLAVMIYCYLHWICVIHSRITTYSLPNNDGFVCVFVSVSMWLCIWQYYGNVKVVSLLVLVIVKALTFAMPISIKIIFIQFQFGSEWRQYVQFFCKNKCKMLRIGLILKPYPLSCFMKFLF